MRLVVPAGLMLLLVSPSWFALASHGDQQVLFSRDALDARAAVEREEFYAVNARVRPLLLFWIGRDNIGGARITWREGVGGRRAIELLVGSDPAHAPRRINRWGFIVEELTAEGGEMLGIMKDSSEQTLEEAEANVGREEVSGSTFRVARTRIVGNRAVTSTQAFQAPPDLSYHHLEKLLLLVPAEPRVTRTVELPAGTEKGFLHAMTSMIARSAPCRSDARGSDRVQPVPYLYRQTLYDLSLDSCEYKRALRTKKGQFSDVIDGRFHVRNRQTRNVTRFQVAFSTSPDLRDIPGRIVFRPRWWMEVELVLDRESDVVP